MIEKVCKWMDEVGSEAINSVLGSLVMTKQHLLEARVDEHFFPSSCTIMAHEKASSSKPSQPAHLRNKKHNTKPYAADLPGVQKIKSSIRQTRRLLGKVCNEFTYNAKRNS